MNSLMSQVRVKQNGRIVGFANCEPGLRRRFLAMGIVKGESFTVLRKAPLGDPIEIQIKGYSLSIRGEEAGFIKVDME